MAQPYKFTKTQVRKAVEESNGTFTSVARNLGCKSSLTSKKFVEKYPDLLEVFHKVQNEIIDSAEDVLMGNLVSDNEFIRARTAEFILKNLPKSRWKDVEGEDVQIQLVKLLDKMMDNSSDV